MHWCYPKLAKCTKAIVKCFEGNKRKYKNRPCFTSFSSLSGTLKLRKVSCSLSLSIHVYFTHSLPLFFIEIKSERLNHPERLLLFAEGHVECEGQQKESISVSRTLELQKFLWKFWYATPQGVQWL